LALRGDRKAPPKNSRRKQFIFTLLLFEKN